MPTYTAVDLGATSGRVVNVHLDADRIALDPCAGSPTRMVADADGGRTWDFDALLHEVVTGIGEAAAHGPVASIGIDSWAVDYGLLDALGTSSAPCTPTGRRAPTASWTRSAAASAPATCTASRALQFLPFNTIYQLVAARETTDYAAARSLLMLPDLINNRLCGSTTNDITNASTTQLLDVRQRDWSAELLADLRLRADLLPPLHEPGTFSATIGDERVESRPPASASSPSATHDTASAVAGTPLPRLPASSTSPAARGPWSACELPAPVTTEAARAPTSPTSSASTADPLLQERHRPVAARGVPATLGRAGRPRPAAWSSPRRAAASRSAAVVDPDDPS